LIFIIGVFLLLFGILIDEGTTLILFLRGYGVLETNPLVAFLGLPLAAILVCSYYVLIILVWGWMVSMAPKRYTNKFFDIFVFIMCLLIISICVNKVEVGMNNIGLIHDSLSEKTSVEMDLVKEYFEALKVSNPEEFKTQISGQYYVSTTCDYTSQYWNAVLIAIFSFLLFKVGFKTTPWGEE
jgi:hypothetical protein